jgi:hypothetical protein
MRITYNFFSKKSSTIKSLESMSEIRDYYKLSKSPKIYKPSEIDQNMDFYRVTPL